MGGACTSGTGVHARLLGIAQLAKEVVGGKIAVLFIEGAADLETMRNDLDIVAGQYFLRQIGIAVRNDAYFAHGLEGNLLCLFDGKNKVIVRLATIGQLHI